MDLELYNYCIDIGKIIIEIFMSDNKIKFENLDYTKINFSNSNIIFDFQANIYEKYSDNFYNLDNPKVPAINFLPYIKNYHISTDFNKLIEKTANRLNYSNYDDSDIKIITCILISLFILNQMYMCFSNPKRNLELLNRLYIFFDNSDNSGHKKRILKTTSTYIEKLNYLKIKFVWLYNSLSSFILIPFKIDEIFNELNKNSFSQFYWIKGDFLKISNYDTFKENIPFQFYDALSNDNIIFKQSRCIPVINLWYTLYSLIKNNYDLNICNSCYHIFNRFSKRYSHYCESCVNSFDNDLNRKKKDYISNLKKAEYIDRNYNNFIKYLSPKQSEDIESIINNKNKVKRNPALYKLDEYYSLFIQLSEQYFPMQKTIYKGNLKW